MTSMKGFTLIELLISSSMMVIAGSLILMIFVQNNNALLRQNNQVSQGLGLNNAVAKLSEDIRSATAIVSSYTSGGTTYTSNLTTLVLTLPPLDGSGNPITSPTNSDYLVINPDATHPGIIRRIIYPSVSNPVSTRVGTNKILIDNATSLKFYYYDKNGVPVTPANAAKINFAVYITQKGGLSNQQSSSSAEINLRNN